MKKIARNPLTLWLLVTAISIAIMFVVGQENCSKSLSGLIMFLFMLLPVRYFLCKLFDWLIDYLSSINDKIKAKLQVAFAYNTLTGDQDKKTKNEPAYKVLHIITFIVCLLMGLLFMCWTRISFAIILSWLETVEFLVKGELPPSRFFFFILTTIIIIATIILFLYLVVRETNELVNKIHKAVIPFIIYGLVFINIFIDKLLLKWSGYVLWYKILIWGFIIVIVPFIIYGIYFIIAKILSAGSKDSSDNSSATNNNTGNNNGNSNSTSNNNGSNNNASSDDDDDDTYY